MLSIISDYKPTNDQDVEVKEKTDNHQWSSFSAKKQTYIRAKLVSVETRIAYSEELDAEEGHFQTETIDNSYFLTFQEGSELKTYQFFEKPTDIGHDYFYIIKNNKMKACYYTEKGFINCILNNIFTDYSIRFLFIFMMVFFTSFLIPFEYISVFIGSLLIGMPFISSGVLFFIRKKAKLKAEAIYKKLKI